MTTEGGAAYEAGGGGQRPAAVGEAVLRAQHGGERELGDQDRAFLHRLSCRAVPPCKINRSSELIWGICLDCTSKWDDLWAT
jgi:hypothetical protein